MWQETERSRAEGLEDTGRGKMERELEMGMQSPFNRMDTALPLQPNVTMGPAPKRTEHGRRGREPESREEGKGKANGRVGKRKKEMIKGNRHEERRGEERNSKKDEKSQSPLRWCLKKKTCVR